MSSLGYSVIGNPNYEVKKGGIIFKGEAITDEDTTN